MSAEPANVTPSPATERVPPHNIAAERSVLGSMLVDEKSVAIGIDEVEEAAFYVPGHRLVFRAIKYLFEHRQPVDLVTVGDLLQSQGNLENAGGAAYVSELADAVPTTANLEQYAQIVVDKWLVRELITAVREIYTECFGNVQGTTEEILQAAEQKVFAVTQRHARSDFVRLTDMLLPTIEELTELSKKGGTCTGLDTGFTELNKLTTGLHGGELIVIAARPSMGKTALALNIAEHVATQENRAVAIFSLEMTARELVKRLLAAHAHVDGQRIRRGDLRNPDWTALVQASSALKKAEVYIDATPSLTPLEVRARCRRLKAENPNLALVMIDYIQLMDAKTRDFNSREQEIAYISRSLKAMAAELDLPVVALSQLNRESERGGRGEVPMRPQLSQLRESGAIEQDADVVILLFRPGFYSQDARYHERADIILAKQRNGPTGTVMLQFLNSFARFVNPSQEFIEAHSDEGQ